MSSLKRLIAGLDNPERTSPAYQWIANQSGHVLAGSIISSLLCGALWWLGLIVGPCYFVLKEMPFDLRFFRRPRFLKDSLHDTYFVTAGSALGMAAPVQNYSAYILVTIAALLAALWYISATSK